MLVDGRAKSFTFLMIFSFRGGFVKSSALMANEHKDLWIVLDISGKARRRLIAVRMMMNDVAVGWLLHSGLARVGPSRSFLLYVVN